MQIGVEQGQWPGERSGTGRSRAARAGSAAGAGEQPVRPQPGHEQRQEQRQHHGDEADAAARGGHRPHVRIRAFHVTLPWVHDPPPQPQPVAAIGRQQAEVTSHARAEHKCRAHRAGLDLGGQRDAEQHQQGEPGDRWAVQADGEHIGEGSHQANPRDGHQHDAGAGRDGRRRVRLGGGLCHQEPQITHR